MGATQLVSCLVVLAQLPGIAEFSTNEIMGHSADRLAAAFGVSRTEQDDYARRSHTLAQEATVKGHFSDLLRVHIPGESVVGGEGRSHNPSVRRGDATINSMGGGPVVGFYLEHRFRARNMDCELIGLAGLPLPHLVYFLS